MDSYDLRFNGMGRLFGQKAWKQLRHSKVAVIGLGGVGSWTAEALARSGIEDLTLIDLDEVCISNTTRQLHALQGNIGRAKVEVMADRMRQINPDLTVVSIVDFFTAETADELLAPAYDLVIDAIDSVENKCLLLALCHQRAIPVVTCGGAGGRIDPSQIRISDLNQSTSDSLLRSVRRKLRQIHGLPSEGQLGIPAVFSLEVPVFPNAQGEVCTSREKGANVKMDCTTGYGSACFVTGSFGFAAASAGIRLMLSSQKERSTSDDSSLDRRSL